MHSKVYTWQFISLWIYRDKAIKIPILSRENDKNAIKLKIIFSVRYSFIYNPTIYLTM